MKVVGLVCSPRKQGNTELMMQEALAAAREAGAETELITVAEKKISPCDGCGACEEKGVCHIKDDMQTIYEQLVQADGIILGTPVYFANVTAQAKTVMDRTYALLRVRKLRGKVAAALVTARRVGAGHVLSILYTYFMAHRMVVAGGGIGYGRKKGEVKEGVGGFFPSALEEARTVGKNVVGMIQRVSPEIASKAQTEAVVR